MPSPQAIAAARQRRRDEVAYIKWHVEQHGFPPNRTELAKQFSIALGTLDSDLRWLRDNGPDGPVKYVGGTGYLTWTSNEARTIRILEQ